MKESELLELAAARRYRQLREKRVEAAAKAGNLTLAAVSRRAAERHVASFKDKMAALAEDSNLPDRYFTYGTEAITAIKGLTPLEANFPAEQLAAWRSVYAAQVSETLEFFQEFLPDCPQTSQLLSAATEVGIIEEKFTRSSSPNGRVSARAAEVVLKTSVEVATDETPQSAEAAPQSEQSSEEDKDLTPEDESDTKTESPQPRAARKPVFMNPRAAIVKPRSPFHSRGILKPSEEDVEVLNAQTQKAGPNRVRRGGSHRSNPFLALEKHFTPADRKKIDVIRQTAEALAAQYFNSGLGTDPDRSHRSTQIRAVFPKFKSSLIFGASPKIGRREPNPEKNFKLSEVIMILLHGSRITQNIIQTKKYQAVIPSVIDQAIAKALQAKQESDV
jgi:hypothetical protein